MHQYTPSRSERSSVASRRLRDGMRGARALERPHEHTRASGLRMMLAGRQTGAATTGGISVELALVLPLLALLVFGCLEMGATFGDWMLLTQVARDASRVGSVGATTTRIASAVQHYVPALREADLQTTLGYRSWNGSSWNEWETLTDNGDENCARAGDQLQVVLHYTHRMLAGSLLSALTGSPARSTITLRYTAFIRRE